jgi:hypothetical protein
MGKIRKSYKVFVRKSERKRPVGISRRTSEVSIEYIFKKVGSCGRIHLAGSCEFRVPYKARNFLTI